MGLRCSQTVPAVVLIVVAVVGILLLVLPAKEMALPPDNMYGIVLDAGSSHTSMYIYKWPADKQNNTGIVTQHNECHVEGGGISSYADNPSGAAKSLEKCLEQALTYIPKFRHHQTPLCLGATAGMRLLSITNATKSQRVMKEVENKLQSYPFKFKESIILSGQAEGVFGWVTVNYLLENFVKMENGILLPTLQSALPFLDLHGTPRLEFHQSVFDELREKLMERVVVIAEGKEEDRYRKLEELLEKSFPLVKMPSIQPVVMQVLKHLPKVPEKKLKMVMADKELYKVCAVEVKRQIWQDNQALFGDEVSPLLKQYIVEKEAALFSSDLSILHNFFSPSPKTRRQGEVVLKLTQMIGKNVKLYDMVLQFLRTLFLRTRNVHYCTLRAELLMSLHDLDISEICSVDPCHKFTWCLDACIREKFVDGKRARELQGFLDGVKKGQEQVLGDLSMILCDPFACNTLVLSIMRNLQELLSQDALPRDSPDLMLLLRMLSLGQGAWDMIDSQVFKEPRLDLEVVTRFLPAMMSVVVDDHTFTVEQKLPSEEKSSLSYPTTLPESFNRYLQENRVACEMGLYYVLHIAKLRNKNALQRLLPALVETYNDMAFGDIFLHLLTGHLTLLSDEFGSEEFCSVVFDGFLLTSFSSKENVHRHTLRMLLHLHHKMSPSYMETLMKTLEPPKQCSEPLKELYNQLTEKMEAQKKSPPPTDETPSLDLGLHPVTVPTTASTPTTPL
uniref:Negative elongation factor complex member B n=1 Tax=Oreochromis niloticus TaxID=8128 RepID=A0A669CGR3_ORENI